MSKQANFAFDDAGLQKIMAERLTDWNPSQWPIDPSWVPVVQNFLASQPGQKLGQFIKQRLTGGAVIYPSHPLRALQLTPLSAVKVVILGQDPYHGPNQAHGLAFSVRIGNRIPPSLRNIFKEIDRGETQAGVDSTPSSGVRSGSLEAWARQGVLLLNTCMTVEDGAPGSHAKQGWEALTDALIQAVAAAAAPTVFMLWGAHAQAKRELIKGQHLVLTANHPSPLSANRPPQPFMGCGHFAAANAWLQAHGHKVINWSGES